VVEATAPEVKPITLEFTGMVPDALESENTAVEVVAKSTWFAASQAESELKFPPPCITLVTYSTLASSAPMSGVLLSCPSISSVTAKLTSAAVLVPLSIATVSVGAR
jgi:hypothetical protein